jgi:hypothetical protein
MTKSRRTGIINELWRDIRHPSLEEDNGTRLDRLMMTVIHSHEKGFSFSGGIQTFRCVESNSHKTVVSVRKKLTSYFFGLTLNEVKIMFNR